jgi:hypothetical protein
MSRKGAFIDCPIKDWKAQQAVIGDGFGAISVSSWRYEAGEAGLGMA